MIHEPFGDVQGGDVVFLLEFVGEDALVHAGPIKGQMVIRLELLLDIIGVEHGILTYFFEKWPHAENIAVGTDQDATLP